MIRRIGIHTYNSFTWHVEWHWTTGVARKEGAVVRMERRSAVAELKFAVAEVRETGWTIVQTARRQIHREASHFAGTAEERASAHARQLLQTAFFRAFVLEPNLQRNKRVF